MAYVRVNDGEGNVIKLVEVDGFRLADFSCNPIEGAKVFRELPKLQFRPDDTLLCAPAKSGTHWVWEILYMLRNGSTEYIPEGKVSRMLEAMPAEVLGALPSPRVLNSHLHYSRLPPSAISQNVKIVFSIRNPKDVVVSWYKHCLGIKLYEYEGNFDGFLNLFYDNQLEYGSYYEFLLEWERAMKENPDRIHLVCYEDLQEDAPREIARLAKFLGVPEDQTFFQEIARKCSFNEMAKFKDYKGEARERLYKGDFSMFRKGKVGGWKDVFTVAQNEKFDRIWAERMKDSTLRFRYTL